MSDTFATGSCACGAVEYSLRSAPMVVHCCHCLDCQRITGSAFVLNLWIEADRFDLNDARLSSRDLPTGSPAGQTVHFCGDCGTYVYSQYHAAPGRTVYVRAGTLSDPEIVRPDVHVWTKYRLDWVPDSGRRAQLRRILSVVRCLELGRASID